MTLTAVPLAAGYVFDSWSGQTEGIADLHQNPVIFQMGDDPDDNREMTANFVPSDLRFSVAAAVQPTSGGSVEFLPEQTAGGYLINQTVSLRAVAAEGYVFSRWAGDLSRSENPRTVRVSEDKSITAIFNPTITTYCSPSQGGSVSLDPTQSANGYTAGTQVTITADPAKGYRFMAWEGDSLGSAKSITITVDEAKTITARFAEQSTSRWWLWVVIGLAGLLSGLILLRLVYARLNRGAWDETQSPDE